MGDYNGEARWGFLLLAAGLCACEPPAPVPTRIEIVPKTDTAEAVREVVKFTAWVVDEQGVAIQGAEVGWWARPKEVATISPTGLVTVTGLGVANITAGYESLAGYARLVVVLTPEELRIVSGDGQSGPAGRRLELMPTVRVEHAGIPLPDIEVEFQASGEGLATPGRSRTDTLGQASTSWWLGYDLGEQTLRASVGEDTVEFTATATEPPLSIPGVTLSRGRLTLPYRHALQAIGGSEPLVWSIASGSLPEGIELDSAGVIAGIPVELDSTTFTVRVIDADLDWATRRFGLRVCGPPLVLVPGEIVVGHLGALCPPFLPSGEEGDGYRVATVRTDVVDNAARVSVAVKVKRADLAPSVGRRRARAPPARPAPRFPPALVPGLGMAEESSRLHARLLSDAGRLVRELGTEAVLPDRRSAATGYRTGAAEAPAERLRLRPFSFFLDPCEDPPPALRTAFLVAHNDDLAIYQDSVQQGQEPIRSAHAAMVLDYYEEYGAPTIDEYFGGVPDVNGDERANVFVSPVVPPGVAAFVWAGDFLSSEDCSWSNEMELVYFNRILFDHLEHAPDSGYQALPTMVHEAKHLSSLYVRILQGPMQPRWIEEGTAEIAAEMSSRMAMEAAGAVARGARLDGDSYTTDEGIVVTPENYGVLLRLARMSASYSGVLNSLNVDPTVWHTYYGTSWHFHRFLGDARGDAAAGEDGAFFTTLNDGGTPPGIPGIEMVTDRSLALHLTDYAAAMMLNGSGAPEPDSGFTTYDFPAATSRILEPFVPELQPEDLYPWFHTGPDPVGFDDAIYSGTLAPGGIRFHDFLSDGTGQGIELAFSAGSHTVRFVIVRVR